MEISCDTTSISDTIVVHGKVNASVTSGLLNVDVNIQADYAKIADDVLKKGTYAFMVKGGSSETQKGINDAMGIDKAKIDVVNIQTKISEWVNSIPTDLTSKEAYENVAVYEQGLAPVWGLFPGQYQSVIRGFFLYLYKDKKTIVDLNDF